MLDEPTEDLWGYAKRLRFVRESIQAAFGQTEGPRVLDAGCGNGSQLAIPLASDERLRITGIDPDHRSIEHARRLAGSSTNLTFICGEIAELPASRPFDVVILSEVLEHLEQPEKMLRSAAQLLGPDGILIVTVPNGYGEFELDSWIFRSLHLQRMVNALARNSPEVIASTDNQECGHLQFFTRSQLRRLFDSCGLVPFRKGAASFLAGPIAGHILARSARFIEWNARVTDTLPFVFASGWYFALRRG
jgi:SAM-dependent methyltransferase